MVKCNKLIPILLIVFMVLTVLPSQTVSAADNTVNISSTDEEENINDKIKSAIDGVKNTGGTITVTGKKTDVDDTIAIYIPENVKVVWKANYEGTASLIYLLSPSDDNFGTFEVTTGATLKTTNGTCIGTEMNINIIISGGVIESGGECAIFSDHGPLTITGGTISASGTNYLDGVIRKNHDPLIIKGGTVHATGPNGTAIRTEDANVAITGGTVNATGDTITIKNQGTYDFYSVVAYLKGTCTGNMNVVDDEGMIVEVDSLYIPKTRNGSDGLTKKAGEGTATWDMSGSTPTINFALKDDKTSSLSWSLYSTTSNMYNATLTTKTFNGKAQGVKITPKNGAGKVTTIYYNGSKTVPTNVGTYSVSIDTAAIGQYGPASKLLIGNYTIIPADISKVKTSIADMAWKGSKVKPTAFKYNGIDFKIASNATVNSYGANKNIGKGTISIKGKGNFSGTKNITFNIVPKKNKISKVTAGKKQMKVTWKKVSKKQKVTKYQVRYRVKGTSNWKTKTFSAKASSGKIKSLKKGKKYQIQVRSYKTVKKVKYPSAWSSIKTSAKIK